jgi:hypothetical protein
MATQPLPPHDDDERETAALSHIPAAFGGPTEALVSGTVGDRCVACGAPLSSDQRYCVVCGERRGAPRFSLAATAAATATETETATVSMSASSRDPRRPRFGSGTTLVAGVATLLLAILVGVLIGHNTANNQKTIAAGPTKIIRVGGGVAAPASPASTPASGSTATGSSAKSSSAGAGAKKSKSGSATGKSKAAKKAPAISKQQAAAQQGAASKVLGGSHNAPPTVTVGQAAPKGTPGVNKKTGKFDGSFFGG